LVAKLELIHEDENFKGAWALYFVHGGVYNGPTYTNELEKLKDALAAVKG
jgi:hypothetical protein